MSSVYVLRNQVNGKTYVGQAKNPMQRKATHFYVARKNNDKRPLYAAMRKYGIENFSFEILEECSDELIDEREKFWVSSLESNVSDKGYNLTSGGQRGQKRSGPRRKLSEEHKRKISEGNTGRVSAMLGKQHSEETKKLMSVRSKGHKKPKRTVEHAQKLGAALKGKSAWNKGMPGENQPRFGKRHSEETKQKMRKPKPPGFAESLRETHLTLVDERHAEIIADARAGLTFHELVNKFQKPARFIKRALVRAINRKLLTSLPDGVFGSPNKT